MTSVWKNEPLPVKQDEELLQLRPRSFSYRSPAFFTIQALGRTKRGVKKRVIQDGRPRYFPMSPSDVMVGLIILNS